MALIEERRRRLAAEGLFDEARKQLLPYMPMVIGVVTSPTGAVIRDILHRIEDRFPVHVIVWPVRVQGDTSGEEVSRAINGFNALDVNSAIKRPDLIIVARGGGSLEDLWAFNEEPLVRAVAACRVPIISAVGHEIDFTLTDFAADVRAETPSAAAELISSHFVAALDRLELAGEGLSRHMEDRLETTRARVDHAASRLRLLSPGGQIEQGFLRLDDYANRLTAVLRAGLQDRRHQLAVAGATLDRVSPELRVRNESQRLLALWKRLQSVSPKSVLLRGFAIVRDESGNPLARRAGIVSGQKLSAEFSDGSLPVRVE